MSAPALAPSATFDAVFRSELGFVCNLLLRLGVREADVEDAAHDVFVTFHRKLAEYDPARPVRAWLAGIAVRVASDHRRRAHHRREVHALPIEQVDPSPSAEDEVDASKTRALVLEALEDVREERRPVLVLHDIEGLSASQIAEALGVPLNTVYSRLRLARADMRAAVHKRREAAR